MGVNGAYILNMCTRVLEYSYVVPYKLTFPTFFRPDAVSAGAAADSDKSAVSVRTMPVEEGSLEDIVSWHEKRHTDWEEGTRSMVREWRTSNDAAHGLVPKIKVRCEYAVHSTPLNSASPKGPQYVIRYRFLALVGTHLKFPRGDYR